MTPDGDLENVAPGSYFLENINDRHHRIYNRKEK